MSAKTSRYSDLLDFHRHILKHPYHANLKGNDRASYTSNLFLVFIRMRSRRVGTAERRRGARKELMFTRGVSLEWINGNLRIKWVPSPSIGAEVSSQYSWASRVVRWRRLLRDPAVGVRGQSQSLTQPSFVPAITQRPFYLRLAHRGELSSNIESNLLILAFKPKLDWKYREKTPCSISLNIWRNVHVQMSCHICITTF